MLLFFDQVKGSFTHPISLCNNKRVLFDKVEQIQNISPPTVFGNRIDKIECGNSA